MSLMSLSFSSCEIFLRKVGGWWSGAEGQGRWWFLSRVGKCLLIKVKDVNADQYSTPIFNDCL